MVAFNNPDHLVPEQRGLWRNPEVSRELLQFSTVILLIHSLCKTCSPHLQQQPMFTHLWRNQMALPEQALPRPQLGDELGQQCRAELEQLDSKRFQVMWLVHD